MNRQDRIEQKLTVLKPHYIEVVNDSHLHSGHKGSPGTGDSHFTVKIAATIFDNKARIEQHKIINELLRDEFSGGLHALSINILNKKE
jgi:BolA protein